MLNLRTQSQRDDVRYKVAMEDNGFIFNKELNTWRFCRNLESENIRIFIF